VPPRLLAIADEVIEYCKQLAQPRQLRRSDLDRLGDKHSTRGEQKLRISTAPNLRANLLASYLASFLPDRLLAKGSVGLG
jgi:hypothetical protein